MSRCFSSTPPIDCGTLIRALSGRGSEAEPVDGSKSASASAGSRARGSLFTTETVTTGRPRARRMPADARKRTAGFRSRPATTRAHTLPSMDLDVIFLGTGGSVPSARRNTASVLVRRGGDRLLFDCGEGTQRQMQRSTGLIPRRRDLHHPPARRSLPRPARSDQELRAGGPGRAADDLRPARAGRAVRFDGADHRPAPIRARPGRVEPRRGGRIRRVRRRAVRRLPPDRRQRLRCSTSIRVRAASTPARRPVSGSSRGRRSGRFSAGRRCRAATDRCARSR